MKQQLLKVLFVYMAVAFLPQIAHAAGDVEISATGLSQTPYAVYCEAGSEEDKTGTLYFLCASKQPNGTYKEQTIIKVWTLNRAGVNLWYSVKENVTTVVFEESFKDFQPTSCKSLFSDFKNLTTIEGLKYLNTASVTDMCFMFYGCCNLKSFDLSSFNTSNVTNMNFMFTNCSSLTSLDLSSFDTSKVTDMSGMFIWCNSLTSLDLSGFNTSKVTDMNCMFSSCNSLTSLDISSFNTSNVTKMNSMFSGCNSLTSLDLSSFDTSKVTDMSYMLNCGRVTSLDLSNFNTSKVTDMHSMFTSCWNLVSLDLSHFDTSKVTDMHEMFGNCNDLTSLDLSSFDTSSVTDMSGMFNCCNRLASLDLNSFDTSKVTDMNNMFSQCIVLTSLDLSNFNTSKVTDMHNMFYDCNYLTSLDLSGFNTSNVTKMYNMFNSCHRLTSLNLSNFDTSKVTDMSFMFYSCRSLVSLDLSSLDTSKVTDMTWMFSDCSSLRLLDLSQATIDFSKIESNIARNTLVYVPAGTTMAADRKNVVVGDKCEHLVIDYGETANDQLLLSIPYEFTAKNTTINRSFTADNPHTIYLPFAMSTTDYGTFYTYSGYADGNVSFCKLTKEQATANTPYLFKPKQDFIDGIVIESEVTVKTTLEAAEPEAEGFCGVYAKKEFTEEEAEQKVYYLWDDDNFNRAEKGATVDACRAYLKLPASDASNAPACLSVRFEDENNTSISNIEREASSPEPQICNLNGQRVGRNYRGVVIKNGKKIVNRAR